MPIASEEEGLEQYFLGDTHRTVAETPHNLNSSRRRLGGRGRWWRRGSHCIFTIFVEAKEPRSQVVRSSKVQIVDLAGSERLKPYENGSQQNKAGAFLMVFGIGLWEPGAHGSGGVHQPVSAARQTVWPVRQPH